MSRLKAGVISLGFIGPVHKIATAMLEDMAENYAIASTSEEKREAAREQGIVAHETGMELIEDENVDVVNIAGPDQFHADLSIAAMDAGKKIVICEKPMTITLEDGVRVLERAQKYEAEGGVFMTNFNYMGHALPRAVRELHQQGYFGKEDYMVLARYLQDWLMVNERLSIDEKLSLAIPDVWNWRLDGDSCAKKDVLPHLMSSAYFMAGLFPVRVSAQSLTLIPERVRPEGGGADAFAKETDEQEEVKVERVSMESDLYTSVLCEFQNGSAGNFTVTQALAGEKNNWSLIYGGSQKSATWNQKDPNDLYVGQSLDLNKDPRDKAGTVYDPGVAGNLVITNDAGILGALGCPDAAASSYYPGQHPGGHIDAFKRNFEVAYSVALGKTQREDAVMPGVLMGFLAVAVGEAVQRSLQSDGAWVNVDYKGVDQMLQKGKL